MTATTRLALVVASLLSDRAVATEAHPPDAVIDVCKGTCPDLCPQDEDRRPFTGPWMAKGAGAALGLSVGLAVGNGAASGAAPLRSWRSEDAFVLGGAAAAWAATRIFDRQPKTLIGGRWSDCRNGASSLSGVDASVRSTLVRPTPKGRENAGRLSDLTLAVSLMQPFGLALGARPERRERDVLVVGETLLSTILVNGAVKRLADRPRPFAHYCQPQRPADLCADDAHYSFYSGHAAMSFAAAVSAGTLSHLHGYRREGATWAVGLGLATTTAVLRVVADKHYFTDVLVGAAAGAAAGLLIPRLHRPETRPDERLMPAAEQPPAATLAVPLQLSRRSGRGALRAGFGRANFAEVTWHW